MIRYRVSELLHSTKVGGFLLYQTIFTTENIITIKDENNNVLIENLELKTHDLMPAMYSINEADFISTNVFVVGTGLKTASVLTKEYTLAYFYLLNN